MLDPREPSRLVLTYIYRSGSSTAQRPEHAPPAQAQQEWRVTAQVPNLAHIPMVAIDIQAAAGADQPAGRVVTGTQAPQQGIQQDRVTEPTEMDHDRTHGPL